MPEPTPPHRSHTLPLYVGGFLGPFGGAVLAVLIPELRDAFDATTTEIALAVPAYLVPFALLQLISGTLAERIGRRRVVTIAYTVYAVGSIGAAVAPGIEAFLVCRGIQGTAASVPVDGAVDAQVRARGPMAREFGFLVVDHHAFQPRQADAGRAQGHARRIGQGRGNAQLAGGAQHVLATDPLRQADGSRVT